MSLLASAVERERRTDGTVPATAITVEGVSKRHGRGPGAVLALDSISLTVGAGEIVCLVGASGCGKSTLLNLVVGLDSPTAGGISVSGRPTLMFQESALFPWLTVSANVELALRLRGVPRGERRARAAELLSAVRLADAADRRPHELSGGMRQRVALARALAQDADVLLMDEPFGALDAMTRDLLHDELEQLWQERGFTVLFVTHNVREAARLGDRIVVLTSRPGRVAAEFPVDAPRPRRIEDPAVASLAGEVTERLRQEVRRHGEAAGAGLPADDRLAAELSGLDALDLHDEGTPGRLRRLWSAAWPKVAAVGLALALWQAVVMTGWKPEFVLPSPFTTLDRLWGDLATAELWQAIGTTMRRAAVGFTMAVVIGGVVGAAVSRSRVLRSAVGSLITGLQTMPSIAWFPLAVLLFKRTEAAILFVIILGAAPSVANGLISGIDQVPFLLVRAGRVLGARGLTAWRHVVLPEPP